MKKKQSPKRIWDALRQEFRTTINVPTQESKRGYGQPRRKWDTAEQRQLRPVYYTSPGRAMMPRNLTRGDQVKHSVHGTGTIVAEWGSWFSCRKCYAELPSEWTDCPSCGQVVDRLHPGQQVSGKGVFEVRFKDGKVQSISQDWLTPVQVRAAA